MEKFTVMIIDDSYEDRKNTFEDFFSKQIDGIDVEFDIIEASIPNQFKTKLIDNRDKIDAFLIDIIYTESWMEWARSDDPYAPFKKILQEIDKAYSDSVIPPPCFLISGNWNDPLFLSRISELFSYNNVKAFMHPSKFYKIEDLEYMCNSVTKIDTTSGKPNPEIMNQERLFIKSEIEKTREMRCNSPRAVDAVVMFAVPDEKNSAYKQFALRAENDTKLKLKEYGSLVYQRAIINEKNIVFVTQNEMGMTDAACIASTALYAFKPKIIIMIGICAGSKGDVHLGDIIIANQTFDYSFGKLKTEELPGGKTTDTFVNRTSHEYVDPALNLFITQMSSSNHVTKVMRDIEDAYEGAVPDNQSVKTIRVTSIASGPWVVNTPSVFDLITNHLDDKCVALDMEAHAVAHAAKRFKTPWLVIKVVQDYANGNKEEDEKVARNYAAFESASFLKNNLDRILMSLEKDE